MCAQLYIVVCCSLLRVVSGANGENFRVFCAPLGAKSVLGLVRIEAGISIVLSLEARVIGQGPKHCWAETMDIFFMCVCGSCSLVCLVQSGKIDRGP